MTNLHKNKSLLNNYWKIKDYDEREVLMISQRHDIPLFLSKLLFLRNIKDHEIKHFLNPLSDNNFIPNPFILKDMIKAVNRTVDAISKNEKIGIIADYDVDGSTSAAILYKFLFSLKSPISIKIPNRLKEGYGPNTRIMNEFIDEKINLIFSLDCGTSSFGIIDHNNYKNIDVIVIDHHISENKLPNIYSIINPNRFDEDNSLKDLAAVGVTFLFIMGLRKKLREVNYFKDKNEPNLLMNLDLVALGTICDVVNLKNLNRIFVAKGLEILKKRKNKGIAKLIDNSKINNAPSSTDLSYIIGPQLNAASRIDDPGLSSKILISDDIIELESISKKLFLLNEKRKLIENHIFSEAIIQADTQKNFKFLLISGRNWHKGVLGIVASKLVEKFNKPSIVLSFDNNDVGIGSARSINEIDLGNIILNAKNEGLIVSGGGHKMAAGIKINFNSLKLFNDYMIKNMERFNKHIFQKINFYDARISINEINLQLLEYIEKLEPFGQGNEQPQFIVSDLKIKQTKIIKDKHILVIFDNDFFTNMNAICFNSIGTNLGDNLIKNQKSIYDFGCIIKRDNFNSANSKPQVIIQDAILVN